MREDPTDLLQPIDVLICAIASTILLCFIFAPAVHTLYYNGDDYRYAFGGITKACINDDGFEMMMLIGRPIQAYLDCFSFKFAYTLERMEIIRLITIIVMGCGIGLLTSCLHRMGFSFVAAISAAAITFLLPELYPDTILYGAISLPLAVVFVCLAYHSVMQQRWAYAAALLLCSMLTYQSIAFTFVTLILTKLLFSHLSIWDRTRREIMKQVVFFILVGIIYFMWTYFYIHYYHGSVPDAYRVDHPNFKLAEIAKRIIFLSDFFTPLMAFFPDNITFLTQMSYQGWAIIVISTMGGMAAFFRFFASDFYHKNKSKALVWLIQMIAVAFALFLLSSAFFLIIPTTTVIESRILFGRVTACLAVVLWSLSQCFRVIIYKNVKIFLLIGSMGFFILLQSYQANRLTWNSAFNHAKYLQADIDAISSYLAKGNQLRRIHFIIPKSNYPYDRYAMTQAALNQVLDKNNYNLHWCSLPRGDTRSEKDYEENELNCISSLGKNDIAVTFSYENETFLLTNPILIIQNHYQESGLI